MMLMNNFILLSIFFVTSTKSTSDEQLEPISKREPRFISFDSKDGQIDVDLDLSIPFISIPLKHDPHDGYPNPLVNVNVKSLTIAGLLAAITAFVVPLFFKSPDHHHPHYRRNEEFGFSQAGEAINELLLGNNYVTPCLQKFVCYAVVKSNNDKVSSNSEKIIDGILNLKWFKNITNGTAIDEAIHFGHQSNFHQCSIQFNNCLMPDNIFQAVINELGIH